MKRSVALLLALVMVFCAVISGCQKKPEETKAPEKTEAEKTEAEKTEAEKTEAEKTEAEKTEAEETEPETPGNEFQQFEDGSFISGGIKFPLEEKVTFTFWRTADATVLDLTGGDINNNEFIKEMERRTNVHLEFQVPAVGTEKDQFGLMMASEEIPDIISNPNYYSGGIPGGLEDGYYMDLTELVPKYAPDYYRALLEKNGDLDLYTPDGKLASLAMIYRYDQDPMCGFVIRKDWLDELGFDMPETYDELEQVLIAFRDKKGCTMPLCFSKFLMWCLADGMHVMCTTQTGYTYRNGDKAGDFLLDNEEGVKEYLVMLNRWYEEGLIDRNFMSTTGYFPDASVINSNAAGVAYTMYSNIETKMAPCWEAGGELAAMPFPVKKKGDKITYGVSAGMNGITHGCAVSADCKNVEILLAYFNYLFTEPGYMLANYGIEGDTYNMVDGEPVYTEKMLENISNGIRLYTIPSGWGPAWVDPNRQNCAFSPVIMDACKVWTPDSTEQQMPPNLALTADEKNEYAEISGDLFTYMEENNLKFVTGEKSFDEWDEFVKNMKEMGLYRIQEIEQAALDRYLSAAKNRAE